MKKCLVFALVAVTATLAQKPARIGPDGKPLLNRPDVDECKKRISHMEWEGHNYFLSWREPWHKFEDWDWFNGRNFCRDRCMDLISFDSPKEYELFAAIMKQDNVSSIYTSGRKCNFKGKGCDAEHLQPINQNGWFWAGASNTRIPKTDVPQENTYWSPVGESGLPQPDNHEGLHEGPIDTEFDIGVTIEGLQEYHDEACLAVMNNKYQEGIAWHDVACHFRSVIVCEDSDQLMNLVKSQNGEDVSKEVKKSEKAIELESIRLNEVGPIVFHPHQHHQHQPQQGPPQPHRPNGPHRPRGPPRRPLRRPNGGRPPRRPSGFLSTLGSTFPRLFRF